MRKTVCINLCKKITREIALGNGDKLITNPAVMFTQKAKAGLYDDMCDEDYQAQLDECEEVMTFWNDKPRATYHELLAAVLMKVKKDAKLMSELPERMAESYDIYVKSFLWGDDIYVDPGLYYTDIIDDLTEWMDNPKIEQQIEKIIKEHKKDESTRKSSLEIDQEQKNINECEAKDYTPKEINEYLSARIYGQKEAVKTASILLYNHIHGNKRNILFAGPTGCGKTEIWRVLKNIYPYIRVVDSTNITKEGWSGGFKIRDIFSGMNKAEAEKSIIVFDEFDKFCEPQFAAGGNNVSEDRQNELLKLIEGAVISYPEDGKKAGLEFDSSKISFVFCGSFEHLIKEKGQKEERKSLGFGANIHETELKDIYQQEIMPEHLVKYSGVRQEIAGRINQIVQLYPMTEDDFNNILNDEVISPIRKLEKQYGVELNLTSSARKSLVEGANRTQFGVRFLSSQIQRMLDEQIYEDCNQKKYILGE